jgi:hypothetical protein
MSFQPNQRAELIEHERHEKKQYRAHQEQTQEEILIHEVPPSLQTAFSSI